MLIQKKFDYQPLKRVDSPSGRKYIVGENRPLPSVTTILGKMKDMTHLNAWKDYIGHDKAQKIVTEAGSIGNSMHKNLENYILEKPMTGIYMSQILAKVIIKNAFPRVTEIWGSEVGLYAKDLYAGTCDLIGEFEGVPAIMDFKNSLKDKKKEWIEDYFLQLVAYGMAHDEMNGTDIKKGVVMIATREAKYQEFIIEGDEFIHYQTMWANKLCAYYDRYGRD
jgi:genome maintenance exonuclease 1